MSIITLTSDWNSADFYVGAIKGKILSQCHEVNIVDISHNIQAFNTAQAAFVLRNSYPSFPKGSIHLILVNTEPSDDKPMLAVQSNGHFFIGTDNGIFSLAGGEEPEKVVLLGSDNSSSQSSLDIFCEAACKLASGISIENIGKVIKEINVRKPLRPTIEDSTLTGSVIYIDSYQNAITNISRELFEKLIQNRSFEIYVQSKHYRISNISKLYNEVPVGELLALFNSIGLLEIAINNGNAARLLNLDTNSTVRIEFSERKK
ncbi:MAG: SAM-dependent chlorinase/fluorinase [Bacteroidales bacterium]|nr:SAM-dependent chlorinase/fluorinase [Bacteroidales bacterium]MCB9012869.1 SAM-dependent chlorinase/fluorinase [Bacteroidales bacterium]